MSSAFAFLLLEINLIRIKGVFFANNCLLSARNFLMAAGRSYFQGNIK